MNCFLTGCDKKTEWQLDWFIKNLMEHNSDCVLYVADFGMSSETIEKVISDKRIIVFPVKTQAKGWFKKPRAMLDLSKSEGIDKICWLDTDCEVKGNLKSIFKYTEPGKLTLAEDRPWSKRRPGLGRWFNSGVVVFEGSPTLLRVWADECVRNPIQGDQETLLALTRGCEILKLSWFEVLPPKYNTLRLDYIDNIAPKHPLVVHHTGYKGNLTIRKQIDEKS